VLPFKEKIDIKVEEKVGSLIFKVGSYDLKQESTLKFTPEEALY